MNKTLYCKKNLIGHFTVGKTYNAIFDFDGNGWFTVDDENIIHWLSPYDDRDHRNITNEPFIKQYFNVI